MSATPAEVATSPARWLLHSGLDGVPLTQTHVLARAVVREGVERWPGWWDPRFGPPYRESDVPVLASLRGGLLRLRLMRRRGRRLLTTPRGRELLTDPEGLLRVLVADLGSEDPFDAVIAAAMIATLRNRDRVPREEIVSAALRRARDGGWRDSTGRPLDEHGISWVINRVRSATEAYGLAEWRFGTGAQQFASTVALTPAGHAVFAVDASPSSTVNEALVFHAQLMNVPRVSAWVAVRPEQHLTALHDALQEAFGWLDDHLYSFWTDGRFWGDDEHGFTSPIEPDGAARTADLPIAELDLAQGQTLAYVFDYGDEWRVRLTLERIEAAVEGSYPRVLKRTGEAPPQYPAWEDDEE